MRINRLYRDDGTYVGRRVSSYEGAGRKEKEPHSATDLRYVGTKSSSLSSAVVFNDPKKSFGIQTLQRSLLKYVDQ